MLRRAQPAERRPETDAATLAFGAVRIDPAARVVMIGGEPVNLTAKEFDLLCFFARNPRQVFNRDQLLDQVWGETEYIDPSTVTVHIRRLREKIEIDPGNPVWLATVWGVGYKFEPG